MQVMHFEAADAKRVLEASESRAAAAERIADQLRAALTAAQVLTLRMCLNLLRC